MKFISVSLEETRSAAEGILKILSKTKPKSGGTILVCSGNLGSGKTAFAKELARVLGIKERVTSPTFIIERVYKIPPKVAREYGFSRLVHIDAYRLKNFKELEAIGFKEETSNSGNLVLIEWGERFTRHLPKSYRKLRFTFVNESKRKIALVK